MALEDFTNEDSTLESFKIESQQILARELLGEMPATRATNGEAQLTEDFIEFSAADTQSLYGDTTGDTGPALAASSQGDDFGYDLPAEARTDRHEPRTATGQLSAQEIQGLLQKLNEFKQLQELSTLTNQGQKTVVVSEAPAQPAPVAAPQAASFAPTGSAGGGDSMKQMSQMMQSAAPIAESLAPVLQEVLPQLIEQIGPMMEEVLPMLTEAAGSLASAI